MKINIELMGSLVDYLPDSERGQSVLILKDESTIADLLSHLKIKRRVIVAVNGDECLIIHNFLIGYTTDRKSVV